MPRFLRTPAGNVDSSHDVSWRDTVVSVLFIFDAAVLVGFASGWVFNKWFFVAAGLAALLLLVSRHRVVMIATALLFMAFRFQLGSVIQGEFRLFALGLGSGAAALLLLYFGARYVIDDMIRPRW